MITALELEPGEVVTEAYLIQRLGCGRTPLREALQRLAHEHLLVINPRRGATVANLGIKEFGQLLETLLGVEAFAIRYAAERITERELARLEEITARGEEAAASGDYATWAELDYQLHTTIAAASQNRFTVECLGPLYRQVARFAYLGVSRPGAARAASGDHSQIVAALRARDPDRCERLFRQHVENARERIRAAL